MHATVFVETESQKGILIGKGGGMIRAIGVGRTARDRAPARRPRSTSSCRSRCGRTGAVTRMCSNDSESRGRELAALTALQFEERLDRYLYERAEEARAVRVGEKETSEQAEIVARYADLFTREQHESLRAEEEAAPGTSVSACTASARPASAGSSSPSSPSARTASRTSSWRRGSSSAASRFRCAPRRRCSRSSTSYGDRDELGDLAADASAAFNDERLELMAAGEALDAELSGDPDPVRRSAEREAHRPPRARGRARPCRARAGRVLRAAARAVGSTGSSVRSDDAEPASYHVSYLRRLVAARGHVHEGALGPGLSREPLAPRLRPRRRRAHPTRSATTARRRTRGPA